MIFGACWIVFFGGGFGRRWWGLWMLLGVKCGVFSFWGVGGDGGIGLWWCFCRMFVLLLWGLMDGWMEDCGFRN